MKLFTKSPKALESFTEADGTAWVLMSDGTATRNGAAVETLPYYRARNIVAEWGGKVPVTQH